MDLEHWESWIEQKIRRATEDGHFDDLPGAGKPLASAGRDYEPAWWHREYVARMRRDDRVAQRLRELDRRLFDTARLDEAAMRAEVDDVLSEWTALAAEHDVPDPPERAAVEATWRLLRRGLRT